MKDEIIFKYIKTECGQIKYKSLSENTSIFGRIRLYWFIICATIRDYNIKN